MKKLIGLLFFLFLIPFVNALEYRNNYTSCIDSEGPAYTTKADVIGQIDLVYGSENSTGKDYCFVPSQGTVNECSGTNCFVFDYYCTQGSSGWSYNLLTFDCTAEGYNSCLNGKCVNLGILELSASPFSEQNPKLQNNLNLTRISAFKVKAKGEDIALNNIAIMISPITEENSWIQNIECAIYIDKDKDGKTHYMANNNWYFDEGDVLLTSFSNGFIGNLNLILGPPPITAYAEIKIGEGVDLNDGRHIIKKDTEEYLEEVCYIAVLNGAAVGNYSLSVMRAFGQGLSSGRNVMSPEVNVDSTITVFNPESSADSNINNAPPASDNNASQNASSNAGAPEKNASSIGSQKNLSSNTSNNKNMSNASDIQSSSLSGENPPSSNYKIIIIFVAIAVTIAIYLLIRKANISSSKKLKNKKVRKASCL